jgi:TrmH family RNA methyltransferase
MITSAQNPQYKLCQALMTQRKARLQHGCAIIEGDHLLEAAIAHRYPVVQLIVAQSSVQTKYVHLPALLLADKLFQALTELSSPSEVMAMIRLPVPEPAATQGKVLVLEGIQDPGNVGTILRAAAAFGVDQIWLDKDCADIWSPKVLRAGMGAQFAVRCLPRLDIMRALESFHGKVIATTLSPQSVPLPTYDWPVDYALVMGNEGAGVSEALLGSADVHVMIPMQAGIESLNVGIATAICLYEANRGVK